MESGGTPRQQASAGESTRILSAVVATGLDSLNTRWYPVDMTELDLLQGTLDLLVLRALSFGPQHGYGVARFIRVSSDETFRIQDGALYTALHRLEAREAVASAWGISDKGKRAKFYQLTPRGRQELRSQSATWARYSRAVEGVMRTAPQKP